MLIYVNLIENDEKSIKKPAHDPGQQALSAPL